MPTRPVDLNNIKGRIAEALVESIFRRAEFKMTRFGRESDLHGMMKSGRDDSFTPDFLARLFSKRRNERPRHFHVFAIAKRRKYEERSDSVGEID